MTTTAEALEAFRAGTPIEGTVTEVQAVPPCAGCTERGYRPPRTASLYARLREGAAALLALSWAPLCVSCWQEYGTGNIGPDEAQLFVWAPNTTWPPVC